MEMDGIAIVEGNNMEEVLHRNADPIKVKLIKGQKDTYGWEISVQGNKEGEILTEILRLDSELRVAKPPAQEK